MAKLEALIAELDRLGGSLALIGPTLAAEKIVSEIGRAHV